MTTESKIDDAMYRVELQRDIDAPVEDVFARLIDVPGYSSWLPKKSASRSCGLTSDGPVDVGTTYVDHTVLGPMVGEVLELQRPTRVVFRQRLSRLGRVVFEALQTNMLEAIEGGTRVHHRFDGKLFGPARLLRPFGPRMSGKERRIVLDALKASVEK